MLREQTILVCDACGEQTEPASNARLAREWALDHDWEIASVRNRERGYGSPPTVERHRCPRCSGWHPVSAERLLREVGA